jgi:twitching motility protein PilT
MQSLDDAILELLKKKWISSEEAYDKAIEKGRFVQFLKEPPEEFS